MGKPRKPDGEEEAGGLVKNRRTNKREAGPGKNKTPRRQKPVEETGFLPADPLPKREEATKSRPPAPRFEICPLCGFFNKAAGYPTCPSDHKRYLAYTAACADQMVAGQKVRVKTEDEWILERLDLEQFEKELQQARAERDRIAERVAERIKRIFGDQSLPSETLQPHRVRFMNEMRREDFYRVRRLFARLQAAQKLKPELERMLAEKAAVETAPPS